MAPCQRPLIERYRDRLPLEPGDPVVTLNEGSTPLIARAAALGADRRATPTSSSRARTRPAASRTAG